MQVRFSPGSGTSGRSGQRVLAGWRERPVGSPEPGTSCHRRPRPSWKAPEWPRDAPVEIENGQGKICFNNDLLKFNPNCFAKTVAQCSVTTYFMFWPWVRFPAFFWEIIIDDAEASRQRWFEGTGPLVSNGWSNPSRSGWWQASTTKRLVNGVGA